MNLGKRPLKTEYQAIVLSDSAIAKSSTTFNLYAPARGSFCLVVTLLLALLSAALLAPPNLAVAQSATGREVAERLQRGVDNPAQEDNVFHRAEAVSGLQQVKDNMRKLYKKLLVSEVGGEVDKAYNPHLRDANFFPNTRRAMAMTRAKSGAVTTIFIPFFNCWSCTNGLGTTQTACDLCNIMPCPWNIRWPDHHIHRECCARPLPVNTSVYARFVEDTNFKACCVREEQVSDNEELVACKSKNPIFNPAGAIPERGDGWAGLTESDFWMTAFGLENARGTSMIATQQEVTQCLSEADAIMENEQSANWIADSIELNNKWADMAGGNPAVPAEGIAGAANPLAQVTEEIKIVRPSGANKNLRMADSLNGDGRIVRPNVAVMDVLERTMLAERFCFRPEQYLKLMDPRYDKLQLGGGPDWPDLMSPEMLWANYCRNGATLMTSPALSAIDNFHRTPTDFVKGMQAWQQDPLFCHRIHDNQNLNFKYLGIDQVLKSTQQGAGVKNAASVGYTCMEGGRLNTRMVPVTLYGNSVVERRTAIADRLFGFLIAGTLARNPPMSAQLKSYIKGFEPRPYSLWGPEPPDPSFQTFIGKQVVGGSTNELGKPCVNIAGNNYQYKNRSDQIYLSDYTHAPFTQEILVNSQSIGETGGGDMGFNRYVQDWAKNDLRSQKLIAKREIDRDGSNMSAESNDRKVLTYGSASRIVAVCPKGYVMWRPNVADSEHAGLIANLQLWCREENFGSPRPH